MSEFQTLEFQVFEYQMKHLISCLTLRVGPYSRWAFIRGWALIKFLPFSASVLVYFATKQ